MANDTLESNVASFLAVSGLRSEHTRRTYHAVLDHLLAFMGERGITPQSNVSQIGLDHAREFAAWLTAYRQAGGSPLSERTRAHYLVVVGGFFRHLVIRKKLVGAEYGDLVELRADLGRAAIARDAPIERRLPDDDMVDALVAEARKEPEFGEKSGVARRRRLTLIWKRDLAMILSLASSGVRVGELVTIRCKDLEPDTHGAYVTGKGNKQRFARFSNEAWAAIAEYLEIRGDHAPDSPVFARHDKRSHALSLPLTTRAVRQTVTRLADAADIAGQFHMSPHKLRHWFATRLYRRTGDLALTQDALGHKNPATTRVYASVGKDRMVEAHTAVFDC